MYYFSAYHQPFGFKHIMNNIMKVKNISVIFFIGVVMLTAVLADRVWWFLICSQYTTFEQSKTAYLNSFPNYLQDPYLLTVIDILLSALAAFLFSHCRKTKYRERTSRILMILSLILSFWSIFSLM